MVRLLYPTSLVACCDYTISYIHLYSAMRCVYPAFCDITPLTIYYSL
nr:MAG TPA: hypothetical protein [Caudoviricetes sp.]